MDKVMFMIDSVLDSFSIKINLYDRVTFVSSEDSGTGKTFLFTLLQVLATDAEYNFVKCLNFLTPDFKYNVERYSRNPENLIVIDNGDVLIDPDIRNLIIDGEARFLIFSRNFHGLAFSDRSMACLFVNGKNISLNFPLAEAVGE